MTTDNKTLADVQPGGRVQVMPSDAARALLAAQYRDDGDRAKAIRINHKSLTDPDKRALRAIEAALSAQPSPGGQGDSRSEKAATFLRQYLTYLRSSPRQGLRPRWCDVYEALEVAIEALTARQPSKQPDSVALGEATEFCIEKGVRKPVGEQPAIPEGWALVDLAEYTVLPQIPTTAMMDAGWPIGEQITDQFDVKGAYADLIAEHEAKGEGIIHGPIQVPAQAVDLGAVRESVQRISLGFNGDLPYIKGITEALALIDGKAVSNG